MNSRALALLAAFGATTIYGLNHTIAKVVMPHYIGPFGFIMLRVVGASVLFWTISLFVPKARVAVERISEWAVEGRGVLGGVGHERRVGEVREVKRVTDGANASVHHI